MSEEIELKVVDMTLPTTPKRNRGRGKCKCEYCKLEGFDNCPKEIPDSYVPYGVIQERLQGILGRLPSYWEIKAEENK